MNKGLEALNELRYRITNFNGNFNNYIELIGTIEKELEQAKNDFVIFKVYKRTQNKKGKWIEQEIEAVEKELKEGEKNKRAVEILRNKPFVDIYDIQHYNNVEDLNAYLQYMYGYKTTSLLTKEEFEFLKEVLL